MDRHEDIRITKSKRDLRNALTELLKEMPFEKITVGAICEKAMINKMTFYKHYQDKYSLFDDCIRCIAFDIYAKSIGIHPKAGFEKNPVDFFVRLLDEVIEECVRQREAILTLVYGNNAFNWFIVKNCIEKLVEGLIEEISAVAKFKYSTKGISSFLTGGFANLIFELLEHSANFSKAEFTDNCRQIIADVIDSSIIMEYVPNQK